MGSFPSNYKDQAKYVRHYTSGKHKPEKKSGTTAAHANNVKSTKSSRTYKNTGKAKGVQYTPQGMRDTERAAHNNTLIQHGKPAGDDGSRYVPNNYRDLLAQEVQRLILGNTVGDIANYGIHKPDGRDDLNLSASNFFGYGDGVDTTNIRRMNNLQPHRVTGYLGDQSQRFGNWAVPRMQDAAMNLWNYDPY